MLLKLNNRLITIQQKKSLKTVKRHKTNYLLDSTILKIVTIDVPKASTETKKNHSAIVLLIGRSCIATAFNLSYNSMIWNRVPKHTRWFEEFVFWCLCYDDDARVHLNYGKIATIDIFRALNISPGTNTNRGCTNVYRNRK